MDVPVPQIQERLVELNKFNKHTNASHTEKTSQDQSLEENILHPSSEQRTKSSADTQVRQVSKSEAHVGSCSVSNVTHSLSGGWPVSRPSMEETMQNTAEVPQVQFIDEAVDVPVVMQRQEPIVQKVQETVEVPQAQSTDEVMDERQVPTDQVVRKTVEVPQSQFIEKAMDTPAGQQRQVLMSRAVQKSVQTPT